MTAIDSKPVVSVIIVTWNGKDVALECLDSLRALKDRLTLEVIVVDNGSTDGTPEAIAAQHHEVKLVRNSANLGFARANNIGMELSTGEFIALVNSDVVVPEQCIDRMVDYMRAHPKIGLMGPKMLSPDGVIGESVYRLPTVWNYLCEGIGLHRIFPNSRLFGGYSLVNYGYDKTENVEALTGWFWMVPRLALERVGGLDERFFMYGEDLDWSYRFQKKDWEVVYFAEAEALHYGAVSSNKSPGRFYVEKAKANLQYFRKHFGIAGALGGVLGTAVHELVRVVGYSLRYCTSAYERPVSAAKIRRSISCLKWLAIGTIRS